MTHDRKSFLNAGDDDLTDVWRYHWDTMGTDFALPILDSAFIPGSSIDLYYGYYGIYTIEDTMLQSNVILSDLNGAIINQNTYQYNESSANNYRYSFGLSWKWRHQSNRHVWSQYCGSW